MSAFKAYDFRGVFGKDFTLDDIYRIGFFLPELLKVNKVLIGRDMRTTSPAIFEALTRGITDAGGTHHHSNGLLLHRPPRLRCLRHDYRIAQPQRT